MNTLKKIGQSAFILAMSSMMLVSCSDDDSEDEQQIQATPGRTITADETWTADQIYTISGKWVVTNGATLTIEPGTIIKGAPGQGTSASALIIAQGAKIDAQGTATQPIIFTSTTDNIQIGETVGTNLDRDDNQQWGGLLILGFAPISAENGDTQSNIEGIPADSGFGKYGGSNAADSSGIMNYVSIRHGGISIGEGNEINGLTLGGVGTGTTLSNIEVYATLDDGVECFGGSVNLDNVLVYYQGDDGIDIDQSYSGTISNFAVISGDGIGTDESLEIDGPEGSSNTNGLFTLSNGICTIEGTDGSASDFKAGAQGNVNNVTFNSNGKQVKFRTKFDDNCDNTPDAYSNLVAASPTLIFTEASIPSGVTVYDGDADSENPTLCPDALVADQTSAAEAIEMMGGGATINPATTFAWTCAGQRGQL
jgi:hypothetical protein